MQSVGSVPLPLALCSFPGLISQAVFLLYPHPWATRRGPLICKRSIGLYLGGLYPWNSVLLFASFDRLTFGVGTSNKIQSMLWLTAFLIGSPKKAKDMLKSVCPIPYLLSQTLGPCFCLQCSIWVPPLFISSDVVAVC